MVKAKLIILTCFIAIIAMAGSTPIKDLLLQGTANAGGNSITNLADGATATSASTVGQLSNTNAAIIGLVAAEAVLRVAADDALGVRIDSATNGIVEAEALLRVAGDLAGSNYVDAAILTVSTNYVMAVELTSGRYQLYLVTE